jgi:hypothetical protein
MPATVSARDLLRSLVGKEIRTVTGRRNVVIEFSGDTVLVGTNRSPRGREVPVRWVEDAIARLVEEGEVEVSVSSLGYRSAFVGAVLLQVPSATLVASSPPKVRLARS